MTDNYSYATKRKINIINETLGDGYQWPNVPPQYDGMSIDSLYSKLIGDERVNMFFKVSPTTKEQIDHLSKTMGMTKAELMEHLVNQYHDVHLRTQRENATQMAKLFSK